MEGEFLKIETVKTMADLLNENKELRRIIKEVREKLQNELDNHNVTMGRALKIELLEILDKGE